MIVRLTIAGDGRERLCVFPVMLLQRPYTASIPLTVETNRSSVEDRRLAPAANVDENQLYPPPPQGRPARTRRRGHVARRGASRYVPDQTPPPIAANQNIDKKECKEVR
jgi:hypothetical protein